MESETIAFGKKLDDPRWLEAVGKVIARDEHLCQCCGSSSGLEVHFFGYGAEDPWDVPQHELTTLCGRCHTLEHALRAAVEQYMLKALERMRYLSVDVWALLPHVI